PSARNTKLRILDPAGLVHYCLKAHVVHSFRSLSATHLKSKETLPTTAPRVSRTIGTTILVRQHPQRLVRMEQYPGRLMHQVSPLRGRSRTISEAPTVSILRVVRRILMISVTGEIQLAQFLTKMK